MQIVIQQIESAPEGTTIISYSVNMMWQVDANGQLVPIFDSGEDLGKGIWMEDYPPVLGTTYDVEYHIQGIYQWDVDICSKPSAPLSVCVVNDMIKFCGPVVVGYPAGTPAIMVLNVGTNLMIDYTGTPAAIGSFACLRVPYTAVEIYPYF